MLLFTFAYIFYEFYTSPRIRMTKFTWKNIEKNKWVYSSYRITFDIKDSWNFGNDIEENFVIFGIDNNSSYRSDNGKNNCLLSGEGPTSDFMAFLVIQKKHFELILVKETQTFAYACIIMAITVIYL